MNSGNQHQMVVKNTFPTGAQEWYCPTCGRHFIIQWPPNYKRIILDEGDEQVAHTGGTDGLMMGSMDILPAEPERDPMPKNGSQEEQGDTNDLSDPYLSPWARWMDDKKI